MRLKTKLVLASTVFSTVLTAALLSIFFVQLLRVRLDEAAAANNTLGQSLILSSRQALRNGLATHPPTEATEAAFEQAVTSALQQDPALHNDIDSIVRYAPTVQDVQVTGANGLVLVASDPLAEGAPPPRRASLDSAVHGSLRTQLALIFGGPQVLDASFGLRRNGRPFLFAHLGIRSTLLQNALKPWLLQALWIGSLALGCSVVVAFLLSSVALQPIERISRQLEKLEIDAAGETRGEPLHTPMPAAEASPRARDAVRDADSRIARLDERMRRSAELTSDLQTNLSQMLHTLQDGILLLSNEGTVLVASDAVQRFVSEENRVTPGMRIASLFPVSAPVGRLIQDALSAERALQRTPTKLADGTPVEVTLSFPQRQPGTRANFGAMLTLHDSAAQQAVEQEIEVGRRLASIGRLTAGVGHEVKNPINAMVLHLELLRGKLRNGGTTDATRHVDVLASEMQRLDRVVQTLADFSRPLEPELRAQPLRPIVEAVLQLVSVDAAVRRIHLVQRGDAANACAKVDSSLLHQALLNIVLNAMDAMPDGGTLELSLTQSQGSAHISVRDTGSGIPPELLDRIFHLYFTTKDTGTGIGLAMTWRIVQMMGGTVQVQSQVRSQTASAEAEHGTLFTVALPLSSSPSSRNSAFGAQA